MVERIEVVNDTGCHHNVTPEQLPAFLEAGWIKVQPAPESKETDQEKPAKKRSK